MEKKFVYILRGLPASGKSTWAKEWAEKDPENRIIISKDGLREMFGKYWVPKREDLVEMIFLVIFNHILGELKYDIVLDTTGFNEYFYNKIKSFVDESNKMELLAKKTVELKGQVYYPTIYTIEFLDFFSTSVEECVRRDKLRERSVGKDVIRGFYEKYKSIINP